MPRAPVICITHGGGPMPVLEPQMGSHGHDALNESLRTRVREILRLGTSEAPRAIVVITPHWRPEYPTVTMVDKPPICYDFEPSHPPAAWDIQYEAPGSSEVANLVYDALSAVDLKPGKDFDRGFDHGVFIPFIFISPSGEVPLISVSISSSSNPDMYSRMGQALVKLREDNIAVVGSGFASYHNVPMMRKLYFADPASEEMTEWRNKVANFNRALTDIVMTKDPGERAKSLLKWRELPSAYDVHPDNEDEHILPLFVSAGAADNSKGGFFADPFGGVEVYTFYWSE
ncbi:Putative extradiol ring-cleavage dioxygenase, class III enzyme, subunit B [Colletotrichum destructivum]|uniref:Extradiol ring-cleavage dioxygenase, class III enzyme, subunit B n=1 Tax=Colletotrichum destructivum TaxID=34406 RepID=A0AAX4I710_9PEZI|nr:Putative extradiol ring-cleavage dioxygenase, class III enzyme, subunit B [Colletotrichum destructivum]